MNRVNRIAFWLAIVSIIAGTLFAMTLVWVDVENEVVWRCFMTVGILFCASCLTLAVNGMIRRLSKQKEGE